MPTLKSKEVFSEVLRFLYRTTQVITANPAFQNDVQRQQIAMMVITSGIKVFHESSHTDSLEVVQVDPILDQVGTEIMNGFNAITIAIMKIDQITLPEPLEILRKSEEIDKGIDLLVDTLIDIYTGTPEAE